MLSDNLTNNPCSNQSRIEDKVDRLEKVIEGYDERFNTRNLHTQNLTAENAKISNIEAAGIKSDNANIGALGADSIDVTGSINAKSFTVEDPVIINGVTTPTASIGTLDATDINSVNAKITNLTVDNLMTSPESSLEYKNLSVTNQATINKLNLVDPHIAEVVSEIMRTIDLEVQHIKMPNTGNIVREDESNVVSFVDGATILGAVTNNVNIAGKSRPKWNDLALATLADIQQGGVKPVYRGIVDNYSELPTSGNAKGDLYVVRQLVIADKMGIGHAQWNGESWDPTLIYELELFETVEAADATEKKLQDQIDSNKQAIEDEMIDAVNRETAIIDGVAGSQVKKVADKAVMATPEGDKVLAVVDDVEKAGWKGTKAEFDAQKDTIEDDALVCITDDGGNDVLFVSDEVRDGDLSPVSSNAVFNYVGKTVFQTLFDLVMPVDKEVMQLPGEPEPNVLYNQAGVITSEWKDITDTVDQDFLKFDNTKAIGTAETAGLPNITGDLWSGSSNTLFVSEQVKNNGVFNITTEIKYPAVKDPYPISSVDRVVFDASRSSAVYGNSTTVTPQNKSAKLWKRIK